MPLKDLSISEKYFSLHRAILILPIIMAAVYAATGFPESISALAILILITLGLISYKAFLAALLFIISSIPEGDFIVHIGLGLKIREGFTIHPVDFLFAFSFFIFLIRQLLPHHRDNINSPKFVSTVILFFAFISLAEFVRGASAYGFKYAALDARYSFFFLSFFMAYEIFSIKNGRKYYWVALKVILFGLALHGLFVSVLSLIRDTDLIPTEIWLMWFPESELSTTGRIGSSTASITLVLLPLMIFFRDRIVKHQILTNAQWWIVLMALGISTIIGMGRASIFFIILNSVLLSFIRPRYIPKFLLIIVRLLIIAIPLFFISSHFQTVLSAMTERLTDTEYLLLSFLGRLLSFLNGFEMFMSRPLAGTGFGSMMPLIWTTGETASEWLFIDNAFATIFTKTGVIGGIPFLLISILPLYFLGFLILNAHDKTQKTLYKGLFWTYPSLWITMTMTSAHLIRSRPTIIFFCIFLVILIQEYLRTKSTICQKN